MKKYTKQEGLQALLNAAVQRSTYPQDSVKVDVGIILDDEQWNAVQFAIEAMLIAQCTEDNQIAPDFITEQLHTSLHHIHDTVKDVLRERAEEEAQKHASDG